ncbi:hypothetical protein [Cupriavidus consociatus]|uniref:hypothetical protein n=1 Tax=Cupriavidus consociatus TaxID=2821357 RepID=UPI001AE1AB40|nr:MULTISPECIES: hypothetical protein [unclassified Cupriavidus]MBP0625169.1 hypothetical protein [Cupriavidus sp. LEh25]MDK2661910.1 hypothetical protein [Cupriavidus sp. LEh21]
MILFPLTATCLISLTGNRRRRGTGSARPEQVERVNELLALTADRYIIAGNDEILGRLAERLQLAKTKRGPKYVTGRFPTGDGAIAFVRRVLPHRTPPLSINSADPDRDA